MFGGHFFPPTLTSEEKPLLFAIEYVYNINQWIVHLLVFFYFRFVLIELFLFERKTVSPYWTISLWEKKSLLFERKPFLFEWKPLLFERRPFPFGRKLFPLEFEYICMLFFLISPHWTISLRKKLISPWIRMCERYQLIDYTWFFKFVFHFCFTYLTLCGEKHFCLKWNNLPINWSNGPLLFVSLYFSCYRMDIK